MAKYSNIKFKKMSDILRKLFCKSEDEKTNHKIVIKTSLYKESTSRRKPIYTTVIKNNKFGGTHYTLENSIKEKILIPEVSVHYGTNADDRIKVAKDFIITIEEVKHETNKES